VALTWLTPLGRKRSKGNWALVGARGVIYFLKRPRPSSVEPGRLQVWFTLFIAGIAQRLSPNSLASLRSRIPSVMH
jgi:hypothetical protein